MPSSLTLISIALGSNYFPYRPELNFAYERDCKSYPDYSYDYNHRLPDYYDYQFEAPAPAPLPQLAPLPLAPSTTTTTTVTGAVTALQPLQTRTPPPRVPQMGVSAGGHRRTPSTVSNNSTVLLEHEELLYDYNNLNLNVNLNVVDYEGDTQTSASSTAPATLSKQELYAGSPKLINRMIHSPLGKSKYGTPVTRPASLPFEQHAIGSYQHLQQPQQQTQAQQQQLQLVALPGGVMGQGGKFRSSLKKYNSSTLNGSISSQQGTPTNPTPPDSLTSDDSSYLSAKEGSIGSQHSRVRFSPEAYLDASNLPVGGVLGRRMTSPATHVQQQQQRQRHRHTSSASTPSPSASSSS